MPAPSTRVALIVAGAGVAVAAIITLTMSGGGGSEGDGDVTITRAEVESVHTGLCAAIGHARSGDPVAANGAFIGVHGTIHLLIAAALSDGEEDAAERTNDTLLNVEETMATTAPTLVDDMEQLVTDAAEAAGAIGHDIPERCAA